MLVYDRKAEIQGAGVHVLIVGVSDYVNLPRPSEDPPSRDSWYMQSLESPALSAYEMYRRILQPGAFEHPLKTVRLLLSPSQLEIGVQPQLGDPAVVARATRANFAADVKAWRTDARASNSDVTFFFFCGHGIQRGSRDGILLLEDFLAADDPVLSRSFSIGNIRDGMVPTDQHNTIAKTQFYFIDACLYRTQATAAYINPQVPDIFDQELNLVDDRKAPVFFSTIDGGIAKGRRGQTSFFTDALLEAFDRAAEDPIPRGAAEVWPVTSTTIKTYIERYNSIRGLGSITPNALNGEPVLRYIDRPDIDFIVEISPSNYRDWTVNCTAQVEAYDTTVCCKHELARSCSFLVTTKVGHYMIKVDSTMLNGYPPPFVSKLHYISQRFSYNWVVDVSNRLPAAP